MKYSNHFSPKQISSRYIRDNIIQRAFANIKIIQFEGNDAYINSMSRVFEMDLIEGLVTDYKIVFDETLWLPEDPTSTRNIIEVYYKIKGGSFKVIKLDLRKEIDYYKR
jgi:hypothetical protein